MKIISFNINSIRARLHQLQALIDKHQPDVIGLQETKVIDDTFPLAAVEEMGYHVEIHGQKANYGVAMLTKAKPLNVRKGYPNDADDAQRRMIMCSLPFGDQQIHILNGYFPQGENREHLTKFPAKAQFYVDLRTYLDAEFSPQDSVIVMGDVNVALDDKDIGIGDNNAKRWLKTGQCSFLPEERDWLHNIQAWGLVDTFRQHNPEENDRFSWFDYRSKGFDKEPKRGLRIDAIMATSSLAQRCIETGIDYELRGITKPSDHCPIWAIFE